MLFGKELLISTDMNYVANVKDLLYDNHIKFRCKVYNHNRQDGGFGARRGLDSSMFIRDEYAYQYVIYDGKEDLERAQGILSGMRKK